MGERKEQSMADRFRESLDSNGHAFQYAVIRALKEKFERVSIRNPAKRWTIDVDELPVASGKHETRIDFIMQNEKYNVFIVAECKRTDPAYSAWGFVRNTMMAEGRSERLMAEEISREFAEDATVPTRTYAELARGQQISEHAYHLGRAFRMPNKGEGTSSHNAIEEAVTQVLRGVNGLAETLSRLERFERRLDACTRRTLILPAIFTTAELHCSNYQLSDSDLMSGKIRREHFDEAERKWLYLQYSRSPSLRHVLDAPNSASSFRELLESAYLRTVAIISAGGIDDFFDQFDAGAACRSGDYR